jgi:hypothetical protein
LILHLEKGEVAEGRRGLVWQAEAPFMTRIFIRPKKQKDRTYYVYPVFYEALQSWRVSPWPVSSPTKESRQFCGACYSYVPMDALGFKLL